MFPLMVGPSQSSNRYGSVKRQAPKTQNAYRKVDLAPELAEMLKGYLGPLRGGFIFANGNQVLRSHLLTEPSSPESPCAVKALFGDTKV
jgi:hypothetical protein